MNISEMIVPATIAVTAIIALAKNVDIYSALISGAEDGLKIILRIFPSLIALLSVVYMLRASGALDAVTALAAPVFSFLGIPAETVPLIFIRPLSGSGALGVGSEIISKYGPDSAIGRTAAVMLGSTETTFYTIAVYFGAAKIKNTAYTIPAALIADFASFVTAGIAVRLFYT